MDLGNYEAADAAAAAEAMLQRRQGIEVAFSYHPGRWSEPTQAAGRALAASLTPNPQAWTRRLDQIEEALRPLTEPPLTEAGAPSQILEKASPGRGGGVAGGKVAARAKRTARKAGDER